MFLSKIQIPHNAVDVLWVLAWTMLWRLCEWDMYNGVYYSILRILETRARKIEFLMRAYVLLNRSKNMLTNDIEVELQHTEAYRCVYYALFSDESNNDISLLVVNVIVSTCPSHSQAFCLAVCCTMLLYEMYKRVSHCQTECRGKDQQTHTHTKHKRTQRTLWNCDSVILWKMQHSTGKYVVSRKSTCRRLTQKKYIVQTYLKTLSYQLNVIRCEDAAVYSLSKRFRYVRIICVMCHIITQ